MSKGKEEQLPPSKKQRHERQESRRERQMEGEEYSRRKGPVGHPVFHLRRNSRGR